VRLSALKSIHLAFVDDENDSTDDDAECFITNSLNHTARILRSRWFRILTTLCSLRVIPRLGAGSPFMDIPSELIRIVGETLPLDCLQDEAV